MKSQVIGITGFSGSGKTTLCQSVIQSMLILNWQIAGMISPTVFVNGQKDGIAARVYPSQEEHMLAKLADTEGRPDIVGKWQIFPETINWALETLKSVDACDLLVIDEIGPLEIEKRAG